MIDYYYEFPPGMKLFDQDVRYGFLRGFHPEDASVTLSRFHSKCFENASRVWLENSNGTNLVKNGRDWYISERVNHRELTWIKLQAKNLGFDE